MNSLRFRLALGASLVAIVPLAIAMLVLGARLQSTVRAQAHERLGAALGLLEAQLGVEGGRLAGKLEVLAEDPQLKRLVLLEAGGDAGLREYLANQQYLLDLDYLGVTDPSGRLVADGVAAPNARLRPGREPLAPGGWPAASASGAGFVSLPGPGALALDAGARIRYRDEPVAIVRGGIVLDSLRLAGLRATSGVELVLWDAAGRRVAATIGGADALDAAAADTGRVRLGGRSYFVRFRTVAAGRATSARFAGLVPTRAADETLAALRLAALLLGLVAVAVAVALAFAWSRQVSRPVERLAAFSRRISRGEWDEPLAAEGLREMQVLAGALERMRSDLRDYRDRLVAGERQAAYGRMARKVAHEIKNPLTPIAVSLADLKRSYEQRREDFPRIFDEAVRTIDEEIQSLKRLLSEFSELGRFAPPRPAPCDLGELLDGLRPLFPGELAGGRLVLEPRDGPLHVHADREQLHRGLLNLVQNGLDATAAGGTVRVDARRAGDAFEIEVSDNGPGLTPEQRGQLFVPGFTTKSHGSGLGLTIVERIVTEHGGTIGVDSGPGGTTFTIRLPGKQGG